MKKGTKILLGVAAGGVVGALIWAATRAQGAIPPPPPPPSPPPPGKATLYGQVTSGGKPVAGAEVFAVGIGVVAQSDASGNYIAPDLNLGAVSVSCSKTGYSITTKILTLVEGNNRYDFVLTMLTAVLDLKTIQVAPDNPYVGGLVSIFVTGDAPVAGAYSVSLKVDGILVDTQTVQLGAGYTGYIGLNWIPSAPGIYLAEVDNLSIQFTVLAGGNPIWFMVPASPTLADAAALLAKIQASPYRTPLTLWGEPFPGWPAVELEDAVTHAIMMPEDQLVEISGYVNPNTGEIGNWYGPMYLVPTGYMPRAVMSLPIWARQIYLLMAEL